MKRSTRMFAAISAVLLMVSGNLFAYTVVTRDGHRIETQSKPEIRGIQAFMRLKPHGQLVVIHEERIDWARTEAVNKPHQRVIVPSRTKVAQEVLPASHVQPIEHEILGGAREQTPAPATTPDVKTAHETESTPEVVPTSRSSEALLLLNREYAKIRGLHERAFMRKQGLEDELAGLQSRQVGYASADQSERKLIRALQDKIEHIRSRIGKYETRMNDIRGEAVQHGGAIE